MCFVVGFVVVVVVVGFVIVIVVVVVVIDQLQQVWTLQNTN